MQGIGGSLLKKRGHKELEEQSSDDYEYKGGLSYMHEPDNKKQKK